MNRLYSAAGALVVGLGLASPLTAQPTGADTLLARLTAEALAANPGLTGLAARTRAARARIGPAGALPDPGVSLSLMDLTLPRFRFRESDFTEADLEVRQELPWPGTQGARGRAAEAIARERRADLAVLQRDVIVRTATLYHRLQYVVGAREILRAQHGLLDGVLEITTARYAVGAVPQSDPLAARVARARLDSEQAALEAEEAGLRAKLRALRGMARPESLAVTPIHPAEVLGLYPTLEGRGREELDQHPLLVGRRAAVSSAEATARAETLGSRPDFQVVARYGARPIASDFFSAGVGLRVPLWAGRKQKQLAEAARQDAAAERAALAEQYATLVAELEATEAEARASLQRLRLLVAEVIPAAEAGYEAALRSYRVGQADFQAVLTASENIYQARREAGEVAADHLIHLITLQQLTRAED